MDIAGKNRRFDMARAAPVCRSNLSHCLKETILRALVPLVMLSSLTSLYWSSNIAYGQSAEPDPNRATEILRAIDDLWRGESSHGLFTMQVKAEHYTRTMRLEGWSKGKEKTLVRIVSPLKEKGTTTLKSGNSIYSYLPRTDRTIRLTSGMMMGSWMGSHFTNDDLVKESRREEDYVASVTFEGHREGQRVIEFTLIPRPEAAVVWGKVILTVTSDDYLPLSEVFYDEDMHVARTFTFSDVKPLAGKLRPAVMRVIPSEKPSEYTELVYEQLELDIAIKDEFFSLGRLKRR